jgi:hypothetical protein
MNLNGLLLLHACLILLNTTGEQELPGLVEMVGDISRKTLLMKLHKNLKTIGLFMIDNGSMNKKD